MGKIKKYLPLILCVCMLFPACGKDGDGSAGGGGENPSEKTLEKTGVFLVKDGRSDYRIVLPESPCDTETEAAEELALNFKKASGAELLTVSENDVMFSGDSALLIVGKTKLAKAHGIEVPADGFGPRGFKIKEKDGNVFLVGAEPRGTLYAVWEFLHYEFSYEPYYSYGSPADEIAIRTDVKDRELLKFDISEIPDFDYVENYNAGAYGMRYNVSSEVFANTSRHGLGHNSFNYVPPSVYNNPDKPDTYHPKWFASNGMQLHYTAHGDKQELEALQSLVFEEMKHDIDEQFEKGNFFEYISFLHEDSYGRGVWPKSDRPFKQDGMDSVLALRDVYGSAYPAAMQIRFINPIADRLDAYMKERWNGRRMSIVIFAYQDTEAAPVVKKDGKYVPADESVKLRPNVNVWLAPIYENYTRDFDETGLPALLASWMALASQVSFYFYDYYYGNSMIYFDSTYSLQLLYRGAKEQANTKVMFDEYPWSCREPFGRLRLYLTSKLTWDTELCVPDLIDDFFDNFYKEASSSMRRYFELLRTHTAYLKSNLNLDGKVFTVGPDDILYWPEGLLKQFLKIIDGAYEDIKPVKEKDAALYDKLYDRIVFEGIMPRYLLLWHYGGDIYPDDADFKEAVDDFKADCLRVGITRLGAGSVEEFIFPR